MKLDVRTILVLRHPDGRRVLLLRRSRDKKLFPGLITGIGGKVELARGEGDDLQAAMAREAAEELPFPLSIVRNVRPRLSTILTRQEEQVVLIWFTGELTAVPDNLQCPEGTLEYFPIDALPLAEMVPTARDAIAFVSCLPDDDTTVYNAVYDPATIRMRTNRPDQGYV